MKRKVLLALCLFSLVGCSSGNNTQSNSGSVFNNPKYEMASPDDNVDINAIRIKVCKGGKWGYVDENGNIVIDFKWTDGNEIGRFADNGLATVKCDGKYGYMNKLGKMVIEPQFDKANKFYDGLAIVYKNDKAGYIDESGNYVIEPKFDSATPFGRVGENNNTSSSGLFTPYDYALATLNGKTGLIDKTGEFVEEPFISAFGASLNLGKYRDTYFCELSQTNYILFRENGKKVTDIEACRADCKHSGEMYTVYTMNDIGERDIYVDENGKNILEDGIEAAGAFASNGLAPVKDENKKYGFINTRGESVFDGMVYDYAGSFSPKGYAPVKKNGNYYFINSNGEKISGDYERALDFGEDGLAPVKSGGKFGYINEDFEYVIYPSIYADRAYAFDGDFATIENDNGDYGLIDKEGTIIVPTISDSKVDFNTFELARVQSYGQTGYVNKKGEYIVPLSDISGDWVYNSCVLFETNEGYGVVNKDGIIIEPQYDYVYIKTVYHKDMTECLTIVTSDDDLQGAYRENGDKICDPIYTEIEYVTSLGNQIYLKVQKDKKYGLLDLNGNVILDTVYDVIDA